MIKLKGIASSSGISIGKVFLYNQEEYSPILYKIKASKVDEEIEKFKLALKTTKNELIKVKEKVEKEIGKEHARIFFAHIQILEDPLLVDETIDQIKKKKYSAEYALNLSINRLINLISSVDDPIIKDRVYDIKDVGKQIMNNLVKREKVRLTNFTEKVIIVANDLSPSDAISMKEKNIIGLATDSGGKTSHTSIIARALNIPAVVGLKDVTKKVKDNDTIIVDGERGEVIINPDKKTIEKYNKEREIVLLKEKEIEKLIELPSLTKDNVRITLCANIGMPEEVNIVKKYHADGIGLYRTELLYLKKGGFLSEEEQYKVYKQVLEEMNPLQVTIRTFDLSADSSTNFLGSRGIRYSFTRPDMFKIQLRALLRASVHGNLRILFPMVTTIEEVKKCKMMLNEVKKELIKEKKKYANFEIGIMIEVPSIIFDLDRIAKEVDFVSIGTNDLFQYLFAVDRTDQSVAELYSPNHFAFMKVIKQIIKKCNELKKEVFMCGEMAADVNATVLLLGFGLRNFSMHVHSIPEVKKKIRETSIKLAEKIAEKY